jgi:hypothetical protein
MDSRTSLSLLVLHAAISATVACGARTAAPPSMSLASLPGIIDPTAAPPSCRTAPDSIHFELTARGPFTLCGDSPYLTIQDGTGETVFYTRIWRPQTESGAAAARDSIATLIANTWGQPTICNNEMREWFRAGTSVDLHIERTADVDRPDGAWRVTLGGHVGQHACTKRAA